MNTSLNPTAIAISGDNNSIVASDLKPDYQEFLRFLKILGKDEKTTRMRALDPIKGGAGIKYDASEENFLKYSRMGKNQYFMPNNGGDTDDEITECIAVFIEFDNLSIEEQLKAYFTFNLLEPTVMVFTADKSVHIYWVFDVPTTDKQAWRELQSDLIALTGADKSIKNPSRVMAAVGGVKIQKQTGITKGVAAIVHESGKRYSFEEIRATVPKAPTKVKPSKVKDKPVKLVPPVTEPSQSGLMTYDDAIARIEELSGDPSQYNRYAHNFTQDRTDSSKYRGDCPWHDSASGTAFYLNQSGDGKHRWYCPECQVGGTLLEYHAKIDGGRDAEPPTGKAFLDFIESKFDGIRIDRSSGRSRSQSPATSGGKSTNLVALPSKLGTDLDQLIKDFQDLLETSPKKSEISKFKAKNRLSVDESKLLDDVAREYQQGVNGDDNKSDLLKVINTSNHLSLTDYLPPQLALPMISWASDFQCPEAVLLTVFLPMAAHFIGKSSVRLSRSWVEPPIVFTCVAGKSGSGKSPIFRAIAQEPMLKIQEEIDKEYLQIREEYDSWKRLSREQKEEIPEPPEPFRRLSYISNFTPEALHTISDKFPDHGAFILSDEMSEIINNQGKYSGGRGSDKEELLKFYDGIAPNVARKSSGTGGTRFYVNICGGTQVETLQDLIHKRDVSSGEWSRILFCELPYKKVVHSLVDDETILDLSPVLVDVCKSIQRQDKQEYRLDSEAFRLHKLFCNELEERDSEEVCDAFRLAIKKAKGQSGRLAVILHCIEAACDRTSPDVLIGAGTMARAIQLTRFYLAQADRLYRLQAHTLTPDLEGILSLAQRKGSITPGEVARAFSGKRRKTGEEARALMVQLAEMGIGAVKPSGKSIVYLPPREEAGKVDNVDRKLIKVDKFINDENALTESSLDSKESKVDKVDNFSISKNIEIPPVTSTPTSGGITRNLSTYQLSDVSEAESQTGSEVDCVDKVINFESTMGGDLSTLDSTPPEPLPLDVVRGNLPLLVKNRKYRVNTKGRGQVDAIFLEDVTMQYGQHEVVTGLRFKFWNEVFTVVNPKDIAG